MKRTSKLLSFLLCLTVMFSMCFAFTETTYAEGAITVTPTKFENVESGSIKVYNTPKVYNEAKDFTFSIPMPKKGTLFLQYAPKEDASCYINEVSGAKSAGSFSENGTDIYVYTVPAKQTVTVKMRVYAYGTGMKGYASLAAYYCSSVKTAGTKTFVLGSPGTDKDSTITVKAPSTGYIKVTAHNAFNTSYGINLKASGYKSYNYLSSSNDYTEYIGVKKGTYKIKLSGAAMYEVKVKFTKVKETSAKTTKKKAATIKKKATNKGVIPVNKKTKKHWYKIKNPKTQKMTLVVNAKKMSDGGSIGSVKVTVYAGSSSTYFRVYAGNSGECTITYGKPGTTKAKKGTYYVKVEGNDGASGYYTFKWK